MAFLTTKRMRSCALQVSLILFLCIAFRVFLPNILDCARYHADLSYTIEWGPTYWVEDCMRAFGRPGIKLLCNTRMNAPRHVLIGTSKALCDVRDPVYFDLFATAYKNPSSPIKNELLQRICAMYGVAQSATSSKANVKKINAFLRQVFDSESTPASERQMAMSTLWAGNIDKLNALAEDKNPTIAEHAVLMLAVTQPENFISHKDSAVAGRVAFLLAEKEPERYLANFGTFLGDTTKSDELRETLANEWRQRYYRDHLRPSETPLMLEELFRPALTACRSDGTPHIPVRLAIWEWLYWMTGKCASITLPNSQQTSHWLYPMKDTVKYRWSYYNSGKGIQNPQDSDAILTVRACVTVPETDEAGENMLNRLSEEFLGRETVFLPRKFRVIREAPAIQEKMKALGLPDATVAEILSSNNKQAIRTLIPLLVESHYFGIPSDKQKVQNRLKDEKTLNNLVKIGPAAVPLLLQCYQANAFDSLSLLNALAVCDTDFRAVFAWGKSAKTDDFFKFYTPAVLERLPVYLLAYDMPRGVTLILKGLADETPSGVRLFPVRGRDRRAETTNVVFFLNNLYVKTPYRNCDRLREKMEDCLGFMRVQGGILSETERDQAVEQLRTWLSRESTPGGILTRVCWFRPVLVDKEGKPFVADGELQFIVFKNGSSKSTFGMPYLLPFLPTADQPVPQVKVLYREKIQGKRQVFLSQATTHFSPGIHTLELRLTESK